MLSELELCRKREHKAEKRRAHRGRGSVSTGSHGHTEGHPEAWVQAQVEQAMKMSLMATIFANVKSFFTPRRGR